VNEHLSFYSGDDLCALDVLAVREIIEYAGVTRVPMMPDSVRGIINLRGTVLPVIDLHARLGRTPASASRKSCILVVETASGEVCGLLVDAVNTVLRTDPDAVEPAPPFGGRLPAALVAGMTRIATAGKERYVTLLNLAELFDIDNMEAVS
jgi:purine-binding chemotaxis protein CheW